MDVEQEIYALSAETIATQYVLTQLLLTLSKLTPDLNRAVREAFDDASSIAEIVAINLGKTAKPEQTIKAMRIVEDMRAVIFGRENKPEHGV